MLKWKNRSFYVRGRAHFESLGLAAAKIKTGDQHAVDQSRNEQRRIHASLEAACQEKRNGLSIESGNGGRQQRDRGMKLFIGVGDSFWYSYQICIICNNWTWTQSRQLRSVN